MRILQVLHDNERGGVQTLAAALEQGLSPDRYAFETAYLYPRAGEPVLSKLFHTVRAARRIWRGDFDTLIAYQSTASILVGVVGRLRGCRLRVVHQTCPPGETPAFLRSIDKLVGSFGLYSVNIANSTATWHEFDAYPASYRRSMLLIEHGLDAPSPTHTREEARRRFNLPQSQPILLNVGRLTAQKNQDMLIRALACLPEAHLVLAGGGPKDEALRSLAATLGVTDRLHMFGALSAGDVADLYIAADLFVFPSAWETFGLAAVEAAMVGVPMVVADLPVLREVLRVDGGEPVIYVTPADLEGWIGAIQSALAAPPLPRVVAPFARAMRRKYSRERMIDNYIALLEGSPRHDRSERAGSDLQATAKAHTAVTENQAQP
jgi:glycosyltransferase involved in cell wall biosynthesis